MTWQPRINSKEGKDYIFCAWRHKYVRFTPEEYVRQRFLHHLTEDLGYPAARFAVEVPLQTIRPNADFTTAQRADAILFSATLQPLMLLEFKADNVPLTQAALDQAIAYNRQLQVPWLILHNGPHTLIVHLQGKNISYPSSIPTYQDVLTADN